MPPLTQFHQEHAVQKVLGSLTNGILTALRKAAARLLYIFLLYTRGRRRKQMPCIEPDHWQGVCYMNEPSNPQRSTILVSEYEDPTMMTTTVTLMPDRFSDDTQITLQQIPTSSSIPQPLPLHAQSTKESTERDYTGSVLGERFYAIAPTHFERYSRPFVVPDEFIGYEIPRGTIDFSFRELPPQWESVEHPEGAAYFRSQRPLFTVFTDIHVYREEFSQLVDELLSLAEAYIVTEQAQNRLSRIQFGPENVNLVLDITPNDDEKYVCGYYFINHPTRTIFWMDDFNGSSFLWPEIHGVDSLDHIKHEILSQYWQHCSYFPDALSLSLNVVQELRDIVQHAAGDILISPTAISQFSKDELFSMLDLLDTPLSYNFSQYQPGLSRIVYLLLKLFAHQRFVNFHGQPAARLDLGMSVYDKNRTYSHSPAFKVVRYVLFNAPYVQLLEIESIIAGIDGLLSPRTWKEFMTKARRDWSETTLYSTMLLNANIAFLSIQSVDEARPGGNSPVRIPIYLSILSSLGSILFSLLLLRHSRRKTASFSLDSVDFLQRGYNKRLGYEQLALLHSLPYGLMMWSVIEFIIGFLAMCFWNTANVTRLIVGLITSLLACLVVLHVWLFELKS